MSNMNEILTQLARQREAAWNLEFLTADGEAFAGLYIAPTTDTNSKSPKLTFQTVLDYLLSAFDFEMAREEPDGKNNRKWLWGFLPADESMQQPDKRLEFSYPGEHGVTEDCSTNVHLHTGRYYLVRHDKFCQNDLDSHGEFPDIKLDNLCECTRRTTI